MLPLKKILCPTDFSAPSYAALDHAIELAAHFDAELCLLHIVPFVPPTLPDSAFGLVTVTGAPDDERKDDAMRQLHKVIIERVPSDLKTSCEVKIGNADKEITCAAQEENFDLVVIATHGLGGWRHLVFGSVAEAIVRQSHCPVLTVRAAPIVDAADSSG